MTIMCLIKNNLGDKTVMCLNKIITDLTYLYTLTNAKFALTASWCVWVVGLLVLKRQCVLFLCFLSHIKAARRNCLPTQLFFLSYICNILSWFLVVIYSVVPQCSQRKPDILRKFYHGKSNPVIVTASPLLCLIRH